MRNYNLTIFVIVLLLSQSFAEIQFRPTRDFGWRPNSYPAVVKSASIEVSVGELFVDVIEEVEIEATTTNISGDTESLEFFGTIDLGSGALIRSFLLWNGEDILKAKLKEDSVAKQQYEDVVQRDRVIVRPRDPAIMSLDQAKRLNYMIYPVSLGGTRKIRTRYSIPVQYGIRSKYFDLFGLFSNIENSFSSDVRVKINTKEKTLFRDGQNIKEISSGHTYIFPEGFPTRPLYVGDSLPYVAIQQTIDEGLLQGEYMFLTTSAPDTVKTKWEEMESKGSIDIEIQIGKNVYNKSLYSIDDYVQMFLKTEDIWDKKVQWVLYDVTGNIAHRIDQVTTDVKDDSNLVYYWASKRLAKSNETDLGALLGFVDHRMSLVALEEDVLSDADAKKYKDAGVPFLKEDDIEIDEKVLNSIPVEDVYFDVESQVGLELIKDPSRFPFEYTVEGNQVILKLNEESSQAKVMWVDSQGKILGRIRTNSNRNITLEKPNNSVAWLWVDIQNVRYAIGL